VLTYSSRIWPVSFSASAATSVSARQAHLGCCAASLGPPVELRLQVTHHQSGAGAHPLGDLRRNPVRLAQQGQQQVHRLNLAVILFPGQTLSGQDALLCFLCVSV
jgi:hypothetical protein